MFRVKQEVQALPVYACVQWWSDGDLNAGPSPCEEPALPLSYPTDSDRVAALRTSANRLRAEAAELDAFADSLDIEPVELTAKEAPCAE